MVRRPPRSTRTEPLLPYLTRVRAGDKPGGKSAGAGRAAVEGGRARQLSDLSVRRPVFAAVVAVLLCIVGVVGYLSLSIREYPDTDPPIVSVETSYTGAAASVVETRITQIIEDGVAGVQGIQNINSTSRDGVSSVNIEFDPSRDIDSAARSEEHTS